MRSASSTLVILALLMGGPAGRSAQAAPPTSLKFEGSWKLVVMAYGEDEFFLINASTKDGKPAAEMKDYQKPFEHPVSHKGPTITRVEQKDDELTLGILLGGEESVFTGTYAKAGARAGQVLGTLNFRGDVYPARLEKTDAAHVAPLPEQRPFMTKLSTVVNEVDLKSRMAHLQALINDNAGQGPTYQAYGPLLRTAVAAKESSETLKGIVDKWIAGARPYGVGWVAKSWIDALNALDGKKDYASLDFDLATEATKDTGDKVKTEQQAALAKLLINAAKAAGKADVASAAGTRLEKMETRLDEEYLAKVPPFKPEPYAGRKNSSSDQVVLMELFTGAECPPCVAADVAFDALLKTYKPSDAIFLQYHLHIPGPDPLTNPDTEARVDYYSADFEGTPTTVFNGKAEAGGGGGMTASQAKYDEYRQIIDPALAAKKKAQLDLNVSRSGDEIKIKVSAKAEKDSAKDAKLRLRLVLVEESIRYVGGNRLRFHHHVVRAFPGGTEGKELKDGSGDTELSVNLADVRKGLEEYLSAFEKKSPRAFASTPPIGLKDLAVVAFVQNDTDKRVWQAVSVPVGEGK